MELITGYICAFFFSVALRPVSGSWHPRTGLRDHTHRTHHTRLDSSGRVISPTQRPLLDKTQRSQQRDMNAASGIPTYNLSKRAAALPDLRPRGHWD
jgi:hypothetical protein